MWSQPAFLHLQIITITKSQLAIQNGTERKES